MEIIEKNNTLNAEFGVVLEEKASLLTQGMFGIGLEGATRKFFVPPPTSPPTKPPKK